MWRQRDFLLLFIARRGLNHESAFGWGCGSTPKGGSKRAKRVSQKLWNHYLIRSFPNDGDCNTMALHDKSTFWHCSTVPSYNVLALSRNGNSEDHSQFRWIRPCSFPLAAERLRRREGNTDFWPHSFHATLIGLMLKSRNRGTVPPPPPVPPTMLVSPLACSLGSDERCTGLHSAAFHDTLDWGKVLHPDKHKKWAKQIVTSEAEGRASFRWMRIFSSWATRPTDQPWRFSASYYLLNQATDWQTIFGIWKPHSINHSY